MKHIDDERWMNLWSEKILTSQQVLMNEGDKDMARIFGMMHEMGSRRGNDGIRFSLIKSMRDMVRHNTVYGSEVCYTMGGRYRLPYSVREVIWNAADALNQHVEDEQRNQTKHQALINIRTKSQWIYKKNGGDYKIKQSYQDEPYSAGWRAARKLARTLTHWFKIGVWDGSQQMLDNFLANPEYAIEAINEIQGQEVGDC
jgi:hypothetical protein